MPKISAATVAEHRANQRQALLDAATTILVEEGAAAVTPAAVGARAGLARSSVYQYFPSTAELLATIVQEAFPPANAAVAEAMAGATTPAERIDAYVTVTLRLAADGAHRTTYALLGADIPKSCMTWLHEMHREQAEPFASAIRASGVPNPRLTILLLGGLLQTAMRAVENGAPLRETTKRTLALIHHGISDAKPR